MFMNCTFFGHRDAPSNIKSNLEREIMSLSNKGVKHFYVGNNGNFDFLVQTTLNKLANQNPNVKYSIVLSHISETALNGEQEKTVFPEGQELALPKFAVSKRNEWLLKNSSVVIAYVINHSSNSYRIIEKARRKGLKIINLAET